MNPTRFRLAAIDIDDTLLGPDRQISPGNAEAVRRLTDYGVRVVLASGRSHANMLDFHRALGLTGPLVSSQGAVVRDAENGEIWQERFVAPEVARELIRLGFELDLDVMIYRHDGIYLQKRTTLTDYDQSRNAEAQILHPDLESLSDGIHKVVWMAEPARILEIEPLTQMRFQSRVNATITDPEYLEMIAADADKSIGVNAVARHYDLAQDQVLAFGDGNNDVALLRWAGLGVAVSHARPSAKAAAKLIGPDGDPETALQRAIEMVLARGASA